MAVATQYGVRWKMCHRDRRFLSGLGEVEDGNPTRRIVFLLLSMSERGCGGAM